MAEDSSQNDRQWSGKTGGGNFGQRFLFAFLKKVKVKWLYPVLYPVVPFYCMVNHEAFGNIVWYFRNIHISFSFNQHSNLTETFLTRS